MQELRGQFDTLWAVSDIHGYRDELEQLLTGAGLAVRKTGSARVTWTPGKARQLLIVDGDLIDGGPDSWGTVLLLRDLVSQASAAGSRVIVVLGNHEVAYLASSKSGSGGSEVDIFLRSLPVAAFVGTWLFAHAGYIDAKPDSSALAAYFTDLGRLYSNQRPAFYRALLAPRSLTMAHGWWKHRRHRSEMKASLQRLGLSGVVFGHDPQALFARGTLAMNRAGWLLKLDAGLKSGDSSGMLLRCEVIDVDAGTRLEMARAGLPLCNGVASGGVLVQLPVR